MEGILKADYFHIQQFKFAIYSNTNIPYLEKLCFSLCSSDLLCWESSLCRRNRINFRKFPDEKFTLLLFGDKGKEKPPRIKDGVLWTISFSGFVRRMSDNCIVELG